MTAAERAREVAESSCGQESCEMCARYIRTGDVICRPSTRAEYLDGLAASYPDGIPEHLIPARWAS